MTQQRKYVVDNRLEAYASFFNHEWAKRFLDQCDLAGLADLGFDLCGAWKGAANTFRWPSLTMQFLSSFAKGFREGQRPVSEQLVIRLADKLERENVLRFNCAQQASLLATLRHLRSEVNQALEATKGLYDPSVLWNDYREHPELVIGIVASCRICYAAVFYAYEDFVVRCTRMLLPKQRVRVGREFEGKLRAAFPAATVQRCWLDDQVKIARLVRHALVHNGCRETAELERIQHAIPIVEGELQLGPGHVHALFDALSDCASALVDAVGKLRNARPE